MITKEEVEHKVLSPIEYDIIREGDYLPESFKQNEGLMYEVFHSKEEFKKEFFKCNEGKTSLNSIFRLVWKSDFIHFNEDACGNFIYIKEPIH